MFPCANLSENVENVAFIVDNEDDTEDKCCTRFIARFVICL